ncbi:MAG TPA: primosomal protein N' [Deltaproteobacteria bacterium]|nr:primosomal protein N' [Candidatus Binatota bacterium]HIL12103.1 primosomal protein N' [Deltaproteobacteria bacterium]
MSPGWVTVVPLPPVPGIDTLSYSLPASLAERVQPGVRVLVPLGRRKVTALVTALETQAPAGIKCRDLSEVTDDKPVFPPELLKLSRWMADYYLSSLGEVVSLALGKGLTSSSIATVSLLDADKASTPTQRAVVEALRSSGEAMELPSLERATGSRSLRAVVSTLEKHGAVKVEQLLQSAKVSEQYRTVVRLLKADDEMAEQLCSRAPVRLQLYQHLRDTPARRATLAELAELFGSPRDKLSPLEKAGLVEVSREELCREHDAESEVDKRVELNDEQAAAVAAVSESLGSYRSFLLEGVTASGKTEVYLQLVAATLALGRSALVLVPEISLTHQLVSRLVARFGPTVAVLHSELGAGRRWDQWRRVARGEARIVVGARSAVLAPIAELGLVVVDEEHDGSYKQEDGVRYNGRDVAIVRASMAGCPVVLGSATPSVETWRNANEQRYGHLRLPHRILKRPMPVIETVDLRGRDLEKMGGISDRLGYLMKRNAEEGGQTLLFLNRRGYASQLQCWACGEAVNCSNCSVRLTLHRDRHELRCHHCDTIKPPPSCCPSCGADGLSGQGLGTQRLQDAVSLLLPEASVERMDRDTTSRRGAGQSMLSRWRRGEFDVLIGTQMIAKGHDAPGVTLVGVVHADMTLGLPDFRASERTFQLLSQVAGRAGRGEKPGRVVLQTYQPDHPAVLLALEHRYTDFIESELAEREELGYPPWSRMVMLRFESPEQGAASLMAERAAGLAVSAAREMSELEVRGPAPAPLERLRGRWRFVLQLRAPSAATTAAAAGWIRDVLKDPCRQDNVRMSVDVDPVSML